MHRLRHPNIVLLMGAVWSKEFVALVLEYAGGGSLSDILHNSKLTKSWTWENKYLKIANDVANGMNYLHNQSYWDENKRAEMKCIIHRDLKTGNILLNEAYTIAKVSDFGSSAVYDGMAETMTMTGTPIYMAPEIVRGERYDGSADVYSFAVLCFAMMVPQGDAFAYFSQCVENDDGANLSDSKMNIMNRIATMDLRPEIPGHCNKLLEALVRSCWHPKRTARPSFDIVVEKLSEVKKNIIDSKEAAEKVSGRRKRRM